MTVLDWLLDSDTAMGRAPSTHRLSGKFALKPTNLTFEQAAAMPTSAPKDLLA